MWRKEAECANRPGKARAVPCRLAVGALLLFVFNSVFPSCAVSADDDATMGSMIDLRSDALASAIAGGGGGAPADDELHFCNIGVDATPLFATFQVGALFLTHSRANAEPESRIVSDANHAVLFESGDLNPGTAGGLDITAILRLSDAIGLETRYFGITSWNASRTLPDPLGGDVRFEGFGASIPAGSQQASYASRLYNIEVNVLPLVTEGVPLVLGFRSLQLHERFEVWQVDPVPRSIDLGSHTNNYLYGFQVGVEPYLAGAGGALRLDGLVKAGIYDNHAVEGAFSPVIGTTVGADRDRAAFVGELGVAVVYRLNGAIAVRGGYEMLWLDGVALAPDQSRKTNLAAPSAVPDLSTAFLQGATASLEFAF